MSEYLDQPLRTEAEVTALHDPMHPELRHLRDKLEELIVLYGDYERGTTNQRYALSMAVCAADHIRIGINKLGNVDE